MYNTKHRGWIYTTFTLSLFLYSFVKSMEDIKSIEKNYEFIDSAPSEGEEEQPPVKSVDSFVGQMSNDKSGTIDKNGYGVLDDNFLADMDNERLQGENLPKNNNKFVYADIEAKKQNARSISGAITYASNHIDFSDSYNSIADEKPLGAQYIWNSKKNELMGLYLSHNNDIESVPDKWMKCYPYVYILRLPCNQIDKINSTISNFSKLTKMYLNRNKLKAFPKEILNLTTLKVLDLSFNRISTVPDNIKVLNKLQIFDLTSTGLLSFPHSLRYLLALKELYINKNSLVQVPENIFYILSSLERIELDKISTGDNNEKDKETAAKCRISKEKDVSVKITNIINEEIVLPTSLLFIPPQIKELVLADNNIVRVGLPIIFLKKLCSLNLNNNQLKEFPREIGVLECLKVLDLSNNLLGKISSSIQRLMNLQTLNLYNTGLTEFSAYFMNLKDLKDLNLGKNKISKIPKNLFKLSKLAKFNLTYNLLHEVPPVFLTACKSLVSVIKIYLKGNSISEDKIPWDILEQGEDNHEDKIIKRKYGIKESNIILYI